METLVDANSHFRQVFVGLSSIKYVKRNWLWLADDDSLPQPA